jgi:UDPglucose--hexose-1-phosphate uridylyltransferase
MPELRKDPVTHRWVVFSPERIRRPIRERWSEERPLTPQEDPFLAGNEFCTPQEIFALREGGSLPNQEGWRVRVIPNLYPALRVEGELMREPVGFYDRMSGIGAHEVIIETPIPAQTLELQPLTGIADVLTAYRSRMLDLSRDPRFRYLHLFKNVGPQSGATLPHPHTQLIAMPILPPEIKAKLESSRIHFEHKDRNIFEDILHTERKSGERIVYENVGFTAFCPFASRFPFEVCIMPRVQSPDFPRINDHDLILLADVLKKTLMAYRVGLDEPSYNMVFCTAPIRWPRKNYWNTIDQDFRWHIELTPRLTNLAGFELGSGCYINNVLPEEAARFLREVESHV